MSARRVLATAASLVRLLPAAGPVAARLPRLLALAPPPQSPVRAALLRYSPAAHLATSAAARADAAPPAPPPTPEKTAGKRPVELDLSAVHTKRRVQRKRSVVTDEVAGGRTDPDTDMEVVAYSTAEEYALEDLMRGLQRQNLYHPSAMSEDIHDVLHVSARYTLGAEPREIYLFREGTVVFWNVPELERRSVLEFLADFQQGSYTNETVDAESESMPYSYTEVFNKTRLVNGRILLNMEGSTDLEKYAFSNAMALSVKLGIWEAALERYIDSIEYVTEELKKGGSISMKKEEVLKKNGELFGLRHLINLSSDCLDTPDFYWDKDNLESLYQKTCNHLNITKRTRVMNEKLNHCVELADMLTSNLQDKHHVRLEWMIIVLIMVEVGFEIIHFLERYT